MVNLPGIFIIIITLTVRDSTIFCLIYIMLWIEENYRMGKTRDLFQKIRVIKGTFHAKMGTIKDTNGMDLTEAEDIKNR